MIAFFENIILLYDLLICDLRRRSGVGVISHEGILYAIGGFNGITRMNNGERYNPTSNSWAGIAEMYSPRSNFGIEVRKQSPNIVLYSRPRPFRYFIIRCCPFNPLTAGAVHIRFLHLHWHITYQLLNILKIKNDNNQQNSKFSELHFVKSE